MSKNNDLNKLYYEMLRIRMIEEEIAKRYPEGKMRCPVHLSIGQEAAAVGVAAALKPKDKMVSTHRAHAYYLAKGGSLNGLIGELYGKSTGCSRGNGGSMHLIDLSHDFFGSTSIVGGTIPVGVGLSFADYITNKEGVTIVCIGDAAIEEGVFHESANFASLHNLKVIFVCENNLYSCYTHVSDRQPNRTLDDVARAHGMQYIRTKANDVEDIFFQAKLARVFSQTGPVFLEIPTYRILQHCGPDNDDNLGYRSEKELEYWKALDPLKVSNPKWSASVALAAAENIRLEIKKAFEETECAPFPGENQVGVYVYKNPDLQRSY